MSLLFYEVRNKLHVNYHAMKTEKSYVLWTRKPASVSGAGLLLDLIVTITITHQQPGNG